MCHHKQPNTLPSQELNTFTHLELFIATVFQFSALLCFFGPSGSMWSAFRFRWGSVGELCLVTDERFGVAARGKMGDSVLVFFLTQTKVLLTRQAPDGCSQASDRYRSYIRAASTALFLSHYFTTVVIVHLQTNSQGPRRIHGNQNPTDSSCTESRYHSDGVSHSCVGSEVTVHGWCLVGSMVLCVSSRRLPVIQRLGKVTDANHRPSCERQSCDCDFPFFTWKTIKPRNSIQEPHSWLIPHQLIGHSCQWALFHIGWNLNHSLIWPRGNSLDSAFFWVRICKCASMRTCVSVFAHTHGSRN